MAGADRLRFTVADQDGARQVVRASLPGVHGEALLLCGGEPVRAGRLTEQTFAWLGREVRGGRETVTIGRLQVVLRHHFLEELHPAGRRRRRARAAAQALAATREVVRAGPAADPAAYLAGLPQLARAVAVLRHLDRLLIPDVAAALRVDEDVVTELDDLVREGLAPLGGVAALRGAVTAGAPPFALSGRVLARLLEAVRPTYAVPEAPGRLVDRHEGGPDEAAVPPRVPAWAVALGIVAALAVVSAVRQVVTDGSPATPRAPVCTTVPSAGAEATLAPLPAGGQGAVATTAPAAGPAAVSSPPPGACRAP